MTGKCFYKKWRKKGYIIYDFLQITPELLKPYENYKEWNSWAEEGSPLHLFFSGTDYSVAFIEDNLCLEDDLNIHSSYPKINIGDFVIKSFDLRGKPFITHVLSLNEFESLYSLNET